MVEAEQLSFPAVGLIYMNAQLNYDCVVLTPALLPPVTCVSVTVRYPLYVCLNDRKSLSTASGAGDKTYSTSLLNPIC